MKIRPSLDPRPGTRAWVRRLGALSVELRHWNSEYPRVLTITAGDTPVAYWPVDEDASPSSVGDAQVLTESVTSVEVTDAVWGDLEVIVDGLEAQLEDWHRSGDEIPLAE